VHARLGLSASWGGVPVALVDAEVYDDGSAAVAFVVAPAHRRRGLGVATLRAVATLLATRHGVTRLIGGVEHTNDASARCAQAAGFTPRSGVPDEEGFVDYVLDLESARS
jgi:L-amino acid N-acyltransferase YncA